MADLLDLIRDSSPISAIKAHLDALAPAAREAALDGLGRADQRQLYRKAADAPPLALTHFVPAALPACSPVHHQGRNTLPLPASQRRFQKRFCRPEGDEERLFGYNEAPARRLIGPGYFVAIPCADHPQWAARGSVVVDYFQVPDGPVVAGWPEVVPNSRGLQFFVYRGTRDFMRAVSPPASIGAAYKGEKALDHYFTLCRKEP